MIYIAVVLILVCFAFLGYIVYCDISVRKTKDAAKEERKTKK